MPLKHGSSRATISKNISEMVASCHPQRQAVAAALRMARATGGKVHAGPIHSSVAGRTDHLPMHVASGSYVIPADIISAMGEGNSMAGFKVAKSIFSAHDSTSGTPYGEHGLPYGMDAPHKAGGGAADSGQASAPRQAAPAAAPSYTSTGNKVADARIAAGDQSVINNQRASAMYAAQDSARNGTAVPAHLQQYLPGGAHYEGVAPVQAQQGGNWFGGLFGGGGQQQQGGGGFWSKAAPVIGGLIGGPVGALAGSALGQGYTGLGDMMNGGGPGTWGPTFSGGAYSNALNMIAKPVGGGQTQAPPQRPATFASGGATDGVPIVAAGGEYVIPPEDVTHIGGGDLDHGHKILDAFVKKMRQKTIKTLQGLPGPKKD